MYSNKVWSLSRLERLQLHTSKRGKWKLTLRYINKIIMIGCKAQCQFGGKPDKLEDVTNY
jgi:hypothetical protein